MFWAYRGNICLFCILQKAVSTAHTKIIIERGTLIHTMHCSDLSLVVSTVYTLSYLTGEWTKFRAPIKVKKNSKLKFL